MHSDKELLSIESIYASTRSSTGARNGSRDYPSEMGNTPSKLFGFPLSH
jgi:hypothetical protein